MSLKGFGKVHLVDLVVDPENYKGSPHIYNHIKRGHWSVCKKGHQPNKITSNVDKVTCHACLATLGPIPLHKVIEQAEWKLEKFIAQRTEAALFGFKLYCEKRNKRERTQ
jgi:hypothetical protein